MNAVKTWIEDHLALVLLLGFALGFVLPSGGEYSEHLVMLLIGIQVFFACSKIQLEELKQIDTFHITLFCLARYVAIPLALFYIARLIVPEFAMGILLLSLMPAAIVVASLCSISFGNVALGLSLTIISSLLAPGIIPGVFLIVGEVVSVNVWELFITLILVLFVPVLVYFGVVSRIKPLQSWTASNGKMMTVLLMSVVLAVIVASTRDVFLDHLDFLFKGLVVMGILMAILYLVGFLVSFKAAPDARVSYIYASGAMNNALAIGLAFAYFDTITVLFLVLSELVWSFYVGLSQWVFQKKKN